jgi:hypothetical protein
MSNVDDKLKRFGYPKPPGGGPEKRGAKPKYCALSMKKIAEIVGCDIKVVLAHIKYRRFSLRYMDKIDSVMKTGKVK